MDTLVGASCPGCGALSGMCRCGVVEENNRLKVKVAELESEKEQIKQLAAKAVQSGTSLVADLERERDAMASRAMEACRLLEQIRKVAEKERGLRKRNESRVAALQTENALLKAKVIKLDETVELLRYAVRSRGPTPDAVDPVNEFGLFSTVRHAAVICKICGSVSSSNYQTHGRDCPKHADRNETHDAGETEKS